MVLWVVSVSIVDLTWKLSIIEHLAIKKSMKAPVYICSGIFSNSVSTHLIRTLLVEEALYVLPLSESMHFTFTSAKTSIPKISCISDLKSSNWLKAVSKRNFKSKVVVARLMFSKSDRYFESKWANKFASCFCYLTSGNLIELLSATWGYFYLKDFNIGNKAESLWRAKNAKPNPLTRSLIVFYLILCLPAWKNSFNWYI